MTATVRPATAADAERIAELGREFVEYLRALGDASPRALTAEEYLRDGFGTQPAFAGLVAEANGEVLGYLLYAPGYDIDRGGRTLYIVDLFVTEGARRRGAGRALMQAAARACRELGGGELWWSVYVPNATARRFYESLGAKYVEGLRFMHRRVSATGAIEA